MSTASSTTVSRLTRRSNSVLMTTPANAIGTSSGEAGRTRTARNASVTWKATSPPSSASARPLSLIVGRTTRSAMTIIVINSRLTTNEPTIESGARDSSGPPSASVVSTAHATSSSRRIMNAPAELTRVAGMDPGLRSISSGGDVTSSVPILRVRLDDVAYEPVTDDVDVREVVERDALDPGQDSLDLHQPRLLPLRKVDLRLVAGDDDLGVHPQPREKHLHLHRRRILRLVEDDERVAQRAPAHERERGDLDDPGFERLLDALLRHHLVECVVERSEIGIDLRLHVPGEEAETLPSLHGRPGEHDAPDTLARQRLHRRRDGGIRLPRPRRSDADDDVVLGDLRQILRLAGRLRLDQSPHARQRDPAFADRPVAVAGRIVLAQTQDVVRRELHALARAVDHAACDVTGPRHELGGTGDRHRVAAQCHLHATEPGELDEIPVVHSGEGEHVRPLGGELLYDRTVAHACSDSTLMCSSAMSDAGTALGAPSNSARAAVVFGNAMTSRNDVAPASIITMRSNPNAMPPCGGAPARNASSRKPNRDCALASSIPSSRKIRDCTRGSLIRMLPPPSSVPLSTRSYAWARARQGSLSNRSRSDGFGAVNG